MYANGYGFDDNDGQLGALPAVPAIASFASQFISFKKSPRYGGRKGPLVGTVKRMLESIAGGSEADTRKLFALGRNPAEPDRVPWLSVWNDLLPQTVVPGKIAALVVSLDPSMSGRLRVGNGVAATRLPPVPSESEPMPPVVQETVQAMLDSPAGQELIQRYGPQVAQQVAAQKAQQVGATAKAALPLILGGILLTMVLGRR